MALLHRDHRDDPRVPGIMLELDRLYGQDFDPLDALFRSIIADSANSARGLRLRCLGDKLRLRNDSAVTDTFLNSLFLKGVGVEYRKPSSLTTDDLQTIKAERRDLLDQVLRDYRGVAIGNETLDDLAAAELRSVSVGAQSTRSKGTTPPDAHAGSSEFRGKVVLLGIPTDDSNISSGALYTTYHQLVLVDSHLADPFAMLSVSTDEKLSTLKESIKRRATIWRCWWDGRNGPICRQWNYRGFPSNYLIDRTGTVRFVALQGECLCRQSRC